MTGIATNTPPVNSFVFRFGPVEYDLSSRTHIMGIVNVTPDSFSDGGAFIDAGTAVDHAIKLVDEGADFIDVGGESTKPGAQPVPVEDEISRVLPVIEQLARRISIPISVDTTKPEVASRALDAGATIVNDVTGLRSPELAQVASSRGASMVLMHMLGDPLTMQQEPKYHDLLLQITAFLAQAVERARAAGVSQVIVDPGIGFGKTLAHNLSLIKHLKQLKQIGVPVLVGTSRKSFLGALLDLPANERVEGTAASVAGSILNGANIVRVHDVKEMKRVAIVTDAILRAA